MSHLNEPAGNAGVTINGRKITDAERALIREALGIKDGEYTKVEVGTTVTLAPNAEAMVTGRIVGDTLFLDFAIPRGEDGEDGIDGLNGTGTMIVKRTETLPYGQPARVENEGTAERGEYVFYIPQGAPGSGVPAGAVENTYLSYLNGQYVWRAVVSGGTGGGTTIVNMTDAVFGLYDWESGVVLPPPDPTPTQNIMDATLYEAYRSAINAAAAGSKRVAGADAVINAMGGAQKLTLKRNGNVIVTADYSGFMTRSTVGTDVVISLNTLGVVSSMLPADHTTGTWTMEITGGAGYARKITLPVGPDASIIAGAGFNPGTVSLVIPSSVGA